MARIALIRGETRTQSVVPAILLECQHDGTRQNKAAAEPVMPLNVFAKTTAAKIIEKRTLSLSIGATRDASPSWRARK